MKIYRKVTKAAAKFGEAFIDETKLSLYRQQSSNPSNWDRIGGTVDEENNVVTASIDKLGTFALFEDLTDPAGAAGISSVSFTPRVFSPKGSGSFRTSTSVNYSLGTSGSVSIRIFNTAGRPVKKLIDNVSRNAGQNSEEWDGRDGDGRFLPTGLYIVHINANGATEMKSVAIANQ